MDFKRWLELAREECKRRVGLDMESDFGEGAARELFDCGMSPREAIDCLIDKHDLDDLTQFPLDGPPWGAASRGTT